MQSRPHQPPLPVQVVKLIRLLIFSAIALLVVFVGLINFTSLARAQSSPSGVSPSTHILQNRADREQRLEDRNQLLYTGAQSTNATSENATNSTTLVPSGSSVGEIDAGTNTVPQTAPSSKSAQNPESGPVMPPSTMTSSPSETEFKTLLEASEHDLPMKAITQTQAIANALSQNYDIQVKAYDVEAAQAVIRQAHGTFDPVFNAEGSYEDIRDPQNTQNFIATGGTPTQILTGQPRIFVENNGHYKLALNGKLPTGMTYEFKTQMDMLSNTLDRTSPLSLFTPEYQTFTGVTVDQPFLRGFGTDVNGAEIRAAIVNKLISRYDLEDQMLGTVSQVLQSYNQLTYLTAELQAKREDKDLGLRLVQDRMKSLERGQISSRELNRAESSLAEIIEDYTKAQNEVINQQTILQSLISSQPTDVGQFTYLPISTLKTPELHASVEDLIGEALSHRPKYLEARSKVEEQDIKLVYAKNQKYPQLDLKGTYGVNGLSGSFGNSYYRETIPQGPQWTVGLVFSIPFGNNEAGGKYDEVKARKQQAVLAMKQIELNTDLVVRKLVATIRSNESRLAAMRIFAKTAREGFDQEQTRLEKGLGTDLDVLKYRRDYTEAQARELAALADLNNAFVQLREVTGTLLDQVHVTVQK
jgi:outer membrane protein TolC